MRSEIETHTGVIRDIATQKVLGTHDGVEFYTIGQREGLHLGGSKEPYYVARKDIKANELLVAMGANNPALLSKKVPISDIHWITRQEHERVFAAVRYRHNPVLGRLVSGEFIFDEPVRAVAPGQSIVFYIDNECLGGAIIA